MQTLRDDYLNAYRSLKLTRDAEGVLVAQFHTNGAPFTFTAQDHTEFVDAFYRIAQDRANKIVILTGAGGEFIPGIDFASFGNVADPGVWSQVHDEGVQIVENIANIRVPVIAAIEGRAHVHSEYALLANVIVASEGATFHDVPHFAGGIVPGDGIFTTWSYRAGAGRAEAFLLNPQPLDGGYRAPMGSGRRSSPKRQGAQPGAGIGRAVLEGARSNTPQYPRTLHAAVEGAHRAGSWLRTLTRRGVRRSAREINARQELACCPERHACKQITKGGSVTMSEIERFDVLVFGSRAGGKLTAWVGAKEGLRTAVVDCETSVSSTWPWNARC